MPFSQGSAFAGLNADLNRQDRQARKDIAIDHLRFANKRIFFALFAFFAVQKGGLGVCFAFLKGSADIRSPPEEKRRDEPRRC
jgi:hypothetical protein